MPALLLCLLLVGCVRVTHTQAPVYPFGGKLLVGEGWYETLFRDIERCSGHKGDFDRLEVVEVPAGSLDVYDGADAIWSPEWRLYIEAPYALSGYLLAHELAHYITGLFHLPNGQDGPFEDVLRMCGLL